MESKKLKILMISPQFHPMLGGYERAAQRLSHALLKKGHVVEVWAERRQTNWPKREMLDSLVVRRWWCIYMNKIHSVSSIIGLLFMLLLRGRRYDVWHIHQYGSSAAVSIMLSKLFKIPTVLKTTSTKSFGISRVAKRKKTLSYMSFIKKADLYVTLTKEMNDEVLKIGLPKEKVKIIGNSGVDTKIFSSITESDKNKLKSKLGLPNKKVVLYIGRLSEEKNPQGLLEIWGNIAGKQLEEWILVYVGDGLLKNELKEVVVNQNLNDKVLFVGRKDNVNEWMKIGDVFVLPSFLEGLSNSLLEAMSSSLPIVSSQVSGVEYLIREQKSGYVVDINNKKAFGDKILELCSSEEKRRIYGNNARALIEKEYSLDTITDIYVNEYHKLITIKSNEE